MRQVCVTTKSGKWVQAQDMPFSLLDALAGRGGRHQKQKRVPLLASGKQVDAQLAALHERLAARPGLLPRTPSFDGHLRRSQLPHAVPETSSAEWNTTAAAVSPREAP